MAREKKPTGRESPSFNGTQELAEVNESEKSLLKKTKKNEKNEKNEKNVKNEKNEKNEKKKKRKSEPEPEPEPAEEISNADLVAARAVVFKFKKANGVHPNADELADALGIDEEQAVDVVKQLKREAAKLGGERKRAKVRGYRKLAEEAGYAFLPDDDNGDLTTTLVDRGNDSLKSLVSMSDALRLSRFVPYTPNAPSFDAEEFKARLEIANISLPQGAAREVVANVDSVFKHIINEAVSTTVHQRGAQRVQPSVMVGVCRQYAERMLFKSVIATPGLRKFVQGEAPPNDARELKAFFARVPFSDRGLGLVEPNPEDAKIRKDTEKVARANGHLHNKLQKLHSSEKSRKKLRSADSAAAATAEN